ncbi:hypothetical protein J2W44_006117 [Priestia aryabhattai]|uniref:hypothetical protein n=1 Tax=Priestia aryabhattai TaxID=412384 RepID=UPI0027E51FA8|nr:hypothetical protein [Priestia aryabhattai]MDP9726961.1 hypothetical protein [Priestia aryabhattai]
MKKQSLFTREEVEATGMPYVGFTKWKNLEVSEEKVYVTKTRARELGFPVKEDEEPVGYRYVNSLPSPTQYVPVYDRTQEHIDKSKLYSKEIVIPLSVSKK